jgi:hypothetical protein
MDKSTHMAVDQHGQYEHNLGPYPRAELLRRMGRKHANKMYVDLQSGESKHVGWVIAGRWFTVLRVLPLTEKER